MEFSMIPYLDANATWKQRPFGSVLFRAGQTKKVYLNAIATQMVALVDGIHSSQYIADTLATSYSVSAERTQADVGRLFDRLASEGWLTYNPAMGKKADADEIDPPVDAMSLALTHRCNLRCRHCYIPLEEDKGADAELRTDEWIETIKQIRPFKLMKMVLTGGEPLLRPDLWDIVEVVNTMGVEVAICTNGTLIDEAFVERAQSAKLSAIEISLDGATPQTHEALRGEGTFARTWQGISLAMSAGLPLTIICTVNRLNLEEYIDVVKMVRSYGLEITVNEYLPLGPSRAHRDELDLNTEEFFQLRSHLTTLSFAGVLYRAADEGYTFKKQISKGEGVKDSMGFRKTHNCLGHDGGAHVLPNGDVLVCPMLNWPEMIGGNVRSTPLRDIWERSPAFESLRQLSVDQYTTCDSCANRYLCGGVCRAITQADTGSLEGAPSIPHCLWNQVYYARLARVEFDSAEPLQSILERKNLL